MLPYRLYVDLSPERAQPEQAPLAWSELSFLGGGTSQLAARYWAVEPGEPVSIAEVIASANDEPDFGMDIGLFADNGTDFGQRYGFGIQPFGNPNLDYSSQAPFHMGFYHLDWLTRTAQPSLLRTYPLWRIALFGELAELAFSTGHDYWGWRFLGWACTTSAISPSPTMRYRCPVSTPSTRCGRWCRANRRAGAIGLQPTRRDRVLPIPAADPAH